MSVPHQETDPVSAGARPTSVRSRVVLPLPFAPLDAASVELLGGLLRAHLDGGGIGVVTSHQAVPVAASRELVL